MNEKEWLAKIGKFCIIDYQSSQGMKTAVGELIGVDDNKLILRNIRDGEEAEVFIPNILNSKIRDMRDE